MTAITTPCTDARAPNLFVIGASKCGTSALHHYLNLHTDIFMSTPKEPCFFVDQDHLREVWPIMARQAPSHDLDAYLAMFDGAEGVPYRGEASMYYSQAPTRGDCAAPIRAFAPQARLIYMVKDPVTRAIGHYWQRAKEFQEPLPLAEAIRRNPLYRDTSDYALQLGVYLDQFDRSQIRVIDAGDLKTRRRETLAALFDWLGLPQAEYDDHDLRDVHVSAKTSRAQRFGFVRAVRDSDAWASVREHVPTPVRKALARVATRPVDKTAVDETEIRAWLADYFAPRIEAFEALSGLDCTHWKQSAAAELEGA